MFPDAGMSSYRFSERVAGIKFNKLINFGGETCRTRLYTADAVWYRHPSGQPTNTVIPNLNYLHVKKSVGNKALVV